MFVALSLVKNADSLPRSTVQQRNSSTVLQQQLVLVPLLKKEPIMGVRRKNCLRVDFICPISPRNLAVRAGVDLVCLISPHNIAIRAGVGVLNTFHC